MQGLSGAEPWLQKKLGGTEPGLEIHFVGTAPARMRESCLEPHLELLYTLSTDNNRYLLAIATS